MDLQSKLDIITRNTEEVLTQEQLRQHLEMGVQLKQYIGFEISGFVHLGTGLMSMGKIKDFIDAGASCTVFLADWHAWINDKLGGEHETIKRIARGYFTEALKASMLCWKGDPERISFVLGSDLYQDKSSRFWETFVDVSKHTTLSRIQRSITIMGRKEEDNVDFARLLYPGMQVADVFALGINIMHAGIDQRKAHVIAIEVAQKLKLRPLMHNGEKLKPVAIHHPLLLGLQAPPHWPIAKEHLQLELSEMKMSKSVKGSAIYIHDSPEEIRKKLKEAFCPEKITYYNPVLDWIKKLAFRENGVVFTVTRPQKFGGDTTYESFAELEKEFENGAVHPLDLKNAMADYLITLLEPARKHFEKPKINKMKEELEQIAITR